MTVLNSWVGGTILLLALAGAAGAEVALSQSNDPNAAVGQTLANLLGYERSALSALPDARLTALTREPAARRSARPGAPIVFDDAWLAAQPEATGDAEFECLAQALYHEARGETPAGQAAVGEVILNRVDDPAFPGSICGVVRQGNGQGCQFSYICDGRSDAMRDTAAASRAGKIARALIDHAPRVLTEGATYFHARWVRPTWARRFTQTTQIGVHLFYRKPLRTASN